MIDFFKGVFRTKTMDLEARLLPCPNNTFGGKAEVEFEAWSDGATSLEAEIKHSGIPDGTNVDIVCNGNAVTNLVVMNGFARCKFDSTEFESPIEFKVGDVAQMQIDGQTMYQGEFRLD